MPETVTFDRPTAEELADERTASVRRIYANHFAQDAEPQRLEQLIAVATAQEVRAREQRLFFAALQEDPRWRLALLALDIPVTTRGAENVSPESNHKLSQGIDQDEGLHVVTAALARVEAEHGLKIEISSLRSRERPIPA